MFISARVDRWGAAARLLIGAQYPHQCLTHTSIPPPLRHSCSIPAAPLALRRHPSLFSTFSFSSLSPSISISLSPCFSPPPLSSLCSSPLSSLLPHLVPPRPLLVSPSLSPSLRRYFRPLALSAAVCLPIISPSLLRPHPPPRGPSFFSMSTNNSLPFYPYFLFRFSPAYSRTAESLLFPRTYTLSSFPTRLPNSDAHLLYSIPPLSLPLLLLLAFPVAPIKAAVSKPVALSRTRARSRFFPMRDFFFRCYCRLSDASHSPGFPLSFSSLSHLSRFLL